jgi:hypothetical protein
MKSPLSRALAVAALLLLPARVPSADVLLLKDGKRVEGDVTEQGDAYEVRTRFGTLSVRKEDVARRLKDASSLTAEIESLRKVAGEMADEGLKIEGDAAARNLKLEAAAAPSGTRASPKARPGPPGTTPRPRGRRTWPGTSPR